MNSDERRELANKDLALAIYALAQHPQFSAFFQILGEVKADHRVSPNDDERKWQTHNYMTYAVEAIDAKVEYYFSLGEKLSQVAERQGESANGTDDRHRGRPRAGR